MSSKLTGYLSVRSLPASLESRILTESRKRQMSKSGVVIEALERAFGLRPDAKQRPDVKHFFGCMSKRDLKALEQSLRDQRRIERKLWQ